MQTNELTNKHTSKEKETSEEERECIYQTKQKRKKLLK